MSIGKDKTRKLITLSEDLKKKLEKYAEEEDRNLNNFIIYILKEYIKNREAE